MTKIKSLRDVPQTTSVAPKKEFKQITLDSKMSHNKPISLRSLPYKQVKGVNLPNQNSPKTK